MRKISRGASRRKGSRRNKLKDSKQEEIEQEGRE